MNVKNLILRNVGPPLHTDICLDYSPIPDLRPTWQHPLETDTHLPILFPDEHISGTVIFKLPNGKKIEHNGIKLLFLGTIQLNSDRSQSNNEFLHYEHELDGPSVLGQELTTNSVLSIRYRFQLPIMPQVYESYYDKLVQVRYYFRVLISRSYIFHITHDKEFAVLLPTKPQMQKLPLQLHVGIEDCMQLELELEKSTFHLQDVISGTVSFFLIRIRIKSMSLALNRRTTIKKDRVMDMETLTIFEIMDGGPSKGECIPIRFPLSATVLTPSYEHESLFQIQYFLNLILIDQEDRRYFKQHEITLYRDKI